MTESLQVVAAVIYSGDKILACRRGAHKSLAGKWEFPGGKVESGESHKEALEREIREELGVVVNVGSLLGVSKVRLGDNAIVLHAYQTQLLGNAPSSSSDHDFLQWCSASDLRNLDWAEADIPIVERLVASFN